MTGGVNGLVVLTTQEAGQGGLFNGVRSSGTTHGETFLKVGGERGKG